MSKDELKPCPFCGEEPGTMMTSSGAVMVRCRPCGLDYKWASQWNRRATPPATPDSPRPNVRGWTPMAPPGTRRVE